MLVITDTPASLDRIRNVIMPMIDKKPKQVLIEARLMEVNRDKLRDMGVDLGIGSTSNATTSTVTAGSFGGHILGSEFRPSVFNAKEGSTLVPGTEPYNLGAELVFQKLTGSKFKAVLHALEEDVNTNTLSSPRIMTLDNQEASILVGYHTPILASTVTAGTTSGSGPTQTQILDYYQEIGIRLNVVPQISDEGFINMIIHPSVTSSTSSVTATNVAGTGTDAIQTTVDYPIIDVREAQTQVFIKDGDTIVIGGLLKDIKSKETIGVPFLSKIPLLGGLFRRDIYDTQKVDLLIFITARVVDENFLTPEEKAKLHEGLVEFPQRKDAFTDKEVSKIERNFDNYGNKSRAR